MNDFVDHELCAMSLRSYKFSTLNIVNHSSFTSHVLSLLLSFFLLSHLLRHLRLIAFLVTLFLSSDDLTFSSSTYMKKNHLKLAESFELITCSLETSSSYMNFFIFSCILLWWDCRNWITSFSSLFVRIIFKWYNQWRSELIVLDL